MFRVENVLVMPFRITLPTKAVSNQLLYTSKLMEQANILRGSVGTDIILLQSFVHATGTTPLLGLEDVCKQI